MLHSSQELQQWLVCLMVQVQRNCIASGPLLTGRTGILKVIGALWGKNHTILSIDQVRSSPLLPISSYSSHKKLEHHLWYCTTMNPLLVHNVPFVAAHFYSVRERLFDFETVAISYPFNPFQKQIGSKRVRPGCVGTSMYWYV